MKTTLKLLGALLVIYLAEVFVFGSLGGALWGATPWSGWALYVAHEGRYIYGLAILFSLFVLFFPEDKLERVHTSHYSCQPDEL